MQALVVLVTCPAREEAEKLANAVVHERLAACVNIVPNITSIYRWEGAMTHDSELLLLIKTEASQLDALQSRIRSLHSYAVPEFIALPILSGSPEYLGWIEENIGATENPTAD